MPSMEKATLSTYRSLVRVNGRLEACGAKVLASQLLPGEYVLKLLGESCQESPAAPKTKWVQTSRAEPRHSTFENSSHGYYT